MDNRIREGREREKIRKRSGQFSYGRVYSRCDNHDDNDATDIQDAHGQPPLTLPATLPVTQIFNHYPTRHYLKSKSLTCQGLHKGLPPPTTGCPKKNET